MTHCSTSRFGSFFTSRAEMQVHPNYHWVQSMHLICVFHRKSTHTLMSPSKARPPSCPNSSIQIGYASLSQPKTHNISDLNNRYMTTVTTIRPPSECSRASPHASEPSWREPLTTTLSRSLSHGLRVRMLVPGFSLSLIYVTLCLWNRRMGHPAKSGMLFCRFTLMDSIVCLLMVRTNLSPLSLELIFFPLRT